MIFDPESHQISFACDDEEEDEVNPQEHYNELVNDIKNMMRKIHKSPNENFPDFLWEPVQNDFSDEYSIDNHTYIDMGLGKIEVNNGGEIMDSIRDLKNRYKDYFDYIDALDRWKQYYNFIEDTYGNFDFFADMAINGGTAIPFKRKPKLKNAKKNKYLLEINVPISRINRENGLSDDQIKDLGDELPDQIDIYEDYYEYVTLLADLNKKEEKRLQRESRIRNYRKTSSVGMTDSDAFMAYINGEVSSSNYGASSSRRPLSDDIEAFHEYDGLDEDLKKDAMGLRSKPVMDMSYGVLMSTGQTSDEIDVYSELAKAGYEVGIMMKKSNMDRKAVKMITRNAGIEEDDISPKKAKKLKKKRMKEERKLYESLSANESVRNILTKNRVSFNADDSMLSFTLKDIMKGD